MGSFESGAGFAFDAEPAGGGGAAKDWDTREEAAKRRSLLTDPLY